MWSFASFVNTCSINLYCCQLLFLTFLFFTKKNNGWRHVDEGEWEGEGEGECGDEAEDEGQSQGGVEG